MNAPDPIPVTGPDLDLMRDALGSSTLSHGLRRLGDRWTVQILMGAFMGVRRFDDFQTRLGIPRHTLSQRLKALVAMDMLRLHPYQTHPPRNEYRLAPRGLAMYDAVLMVWDWEHRFGEGDFPLPRRLIHKSCGHAFLPKLSCDACGEEVTMGDLAIRLRPNPRLPAEAAADTRTPRVPIEGATLSLGLRLDRWALMIVIAVTLGCRHFDQLSHVLGIGPSVLSRRLQGLVEAGLLKVTPDRDDQRRRVYLLTPASRALFGYLTTFATWASETLFNEPSSIAPIHRACGKPFTARASCSHCHARLFPQDVTFEMEA
ncbi:winged helix-turn-helix transcriptional regulator [Pararhodobacter sp.]|jgi:DNA-binding HxlR family transcriptional regulator|uniref:winged helix-turn-helix transcriptional regulator n=1 Tax=Pararhodobacter sp. TaxID=2127056 RepID=UPI002FDDC7C4